VSSAFVRIPLKAIGDSGGRPITIPDGTDQGVGAKRRWLFDFAKTDLTVSTLQIRM
jgi:hypothetical protein